MLFRRRELKIFHSCLTRHSAFTDRRDAGPYSPPRSRLFIFNFQLKKRLFQAAFVYFCCLLCNFYDLFCNTVFYKPNYRLIVLLIP